MPATGVVVAHLLALAEADDLAGALIASMASLVHHGALEVKSHGQLSAPDSSTDKVGGFEDSDATSSVVRRQRQREGGPWSGLGNHEQIETFGIVAERRTRTPGRNAIRPVQELWVGVRRGVRVCEADASAAILREVSSPEPLDIALDKVREIVRSAARSHRGVRAKRPP